MLATGRTRTRDTKMGRINLCMYLKFGLCLLSVTTLFTGITLIQELKYEDFISGKSRLSNDSKLQFLETVKEHLRNNIGDSNVERSDLINRGLHLLNSDKGDRNSTYLLNKIKTQRSVEDTQINKVEPQAIGIQRGVMINNSDDMSVVDLNRKDVQPKTNLAQRAEAAIPENSPLPNKDILPIANNNLLAANVSLMANGGNPPAGKMAADNTSKEMPGDWGRPVYVDRESLSPEEKAKYDLGWKRNDYNDYVSSMISLRRKIPDFRPPGCLTETYRSNMPDTSVIICFHNEAWSPLLRLVHSVLDNSPPHLLTEIILVDDHSDFEHLLAPLDEYLAQLPKVKLIRCQKREGIIRARMIGADAARGTVLTYIDSHCECHVGWLEPLLERLIDNPTNVVCPTIGVVDLVTFKIHKQDGAHIGGFDWDLIFNWKPISAREDKRRGGEHKPYWSPTMAGGLFSIHKTFWNYLGAYDEQYEIWGAENMELSFKTWMCGGSIEFIPCSYVSHIFRTKHPYTWGKRGTDNFKANSVRLAEVWLDDYKYIYYATINYNIIEHGDVTNRTELRKDRKCKSFQWYLANVYPEQFVPEWTGEIRNLHYNVCLDADVGHLGPQSRTELASGQPCMGYNVPNQLWFVSHQGELRILHKCLDLGRAIPYMEDCHSLTGLQFWQYTDNMIKSYYGSCLTLLDDRTTLTLEPCDPNNKRHLWTGPVKTYRYEELNRHHVYPNMTFD